MKPTKSRFKPLKFLLIAGLIAGFAANPCAAQSFYKWQICTDAQLAPYPNQSNHTNIYDNTRIKIKQTGSQLEITYKTSGFNYNYEWYNGDGTDSSHRVAAHTWGIFEAENSTTYDVAANFYLWDQSIDYWQETDANGFPLIKEYVSNDQIYFKGFADRAINPSTTEKLNLANKIETDMLGFLESNELSNILNAYNISNLSDLNYDKKTSWVVKILTGNKSWDKTLNDLLHNLLEQETNEVASLGQTIYDAAVIIKKVGIPTPNDLINSWGSPWYNDQYQTGIPDHMAIEWVISSQYGHKCLWAATKGSFAGTGGGGSYETFTQTITLTPDLIGKTIVPISLQKGHHTGSANNDYDKWGYFRGSDYTIKNFILSPGTSANTTLPGATPFLPAYYPSGQETQEPAFDWQFKITGQTDWQTNPWTPPSPGTYTFKIKKISKDSTWLDSQESQTYTLTIKYDLNFYIENASFYQGEPWYPFINLATPTSYNPNEGWEWKITGPVLHNGSLSPANAYNYGTWLFFHTWDETKWNEENKRWTNGLPIASALPPGDYTFELKHGDATAHATVKVLEPTLTNIPLNFDIPDITLPYDDTNGGNFPWDWTPVFETLLHLYPDYSTANLTQMDWVVLEDRDNLSRSTLRNLGYFSYEIAEKNGDTLMNSGGDYLDMIYGLNPATMSWVEWKTGTYTISLKHVIGRYISANEYIDYHNLEGKPHIRSLISGDLATFSVTLLPEPEPPEIGHGITRANTQTITELEGEPRLIPEGHYTYTGDKIGIHATIENPMAGNPKSLTITIEDPNGEILAQTINLEAYKDQKLTHLLIPVTLTAKTEKLLPGTYTIKATGQSQDNRAFKLITGQTDTLSITVTNPTRFFKITAKAKPGPGLTAWFSESTIAEKIIELPNPRGPIQTQPNP
jgi:hypothetical protein